MSEVELKKFSVIKSGPQGLAISELISRNSELIAEERPELINRFGSRSKAVLSVAETALFYSSKEYIIRRVGSKAVSGLATVTPLVREVSYSDPRKKINEAYNALDYWLEPGVPEEWHEDVTAELLYSTTKVNYVHFVGEDNYIGAAAASRKQTPYEATIDKAKQLQPSGFLEDAFLFQQVSQTGSVIKLEGCGYAMKADNAADINDSRFMRENGYPHFSAESRAAITRRAIAAAQRRGIDFDPNWP